MTTTPITGPLPAAAQQTVGTVLQDTLADYLDLSLVAKQAHWNVVGQNFRDAHLHLDELVTLARDDADAVAERAATLGVSPDGRAATVAFYGANVSPADVQKRAYELGTYYPTGQYTSPIAARTNVKGILSGPAPVFWNIEKQ